MPSSASPSPSTSVPPPPPPLHPGACRFLHLPPPPSTGRRHTILRPRRRLRLHPLQRSLPSPMRPTSSVDADSSHPSAAVLAILKF
uniref:Uncharacterized protein n=1 Tax=Leersia perrieri TaxID=77586 RepID=A0A0D9V0N4_9ORYZ